MTFQMKFDIDLLKIGDTVECTHVNDFLRKRITVGKHYSIIDDMETTVIINDDNDNTLEVSPLPLFYEEYFRKIKNG